MIPLEGRRIALIGGAGFIGHHLALALKEAGAEVSVIDGLEVNNLLAFSSTSSNGPNQLPYRRFIMERLELLEKAGIPLYVQDARDYIALGKLTYRQIKAEVIIQLAAVSHAGKANKDPYNTFDHSLRTLENALDTSRDGVEHFVYFSSSMVYGNFTAPTALEESPCEPLGIYGALKFAGEKLVIAYNQVFDQDYTIIRPSALYGERCVSRRVAQIFIENAIQGKDVQVNGDGSDRLDFTYIGDLVSGVILVLTQEKARNQTFNLTRGEGRSIAEMAGIVKDHFSGVQVKYGPKDKLMPERGTLSIDKAKELIGYEPQFPLEVGYARYIEWYKDMSAL